jgi:SAM-dependent methyltransferase
MSAPDLALVERLATVPLRRCPGCGRSEGTDPDRRAGYRPLPFAYRFAGAEFPGGECPQCGLRGLVVQPAPHEFGRLYAREYFAGGDVRCGHVGDYFAERTALLTDAVDVLHDAIDPAAHPHTGGVPGRLLELGCATGVLLEAAQRRGWTVQGVEYSADAAEEAERHGVPVFVGPLEEARLPEESFDVAFLGDVLEHVPDPAAVLRHVAWLLAPGGALVLRGPMATNSLARRMGLAASRALGRTWRLDEPPYHLWEFTPGPLRALVASAGLTVERFVQSKTPPSRTRRRGPLVGPVLTALDTVNVAWTAATNGLGDRCLLVARRPGSTPR